LLLRFLERTSLSQVGAALGVNEEAARPALPRRSLSREAAPEFIDIVYDPPPAVPY
jgi:hypothetical protein